MANSGNFNTSVHSGHYKLQVEWTVSQSVSKNTSTVVARVYLINDWSISIGSRTGNSLTIDGKPYEFTSPAISSTGTHLLATITSDAISHNDDGTKTITMSCSWKMNATITTNGTSSYYGTLTATSGNVTFNTIARASQPSCVTYPNHTQNVGEFGDEISIHMNRKSSSFTHTVRYEYGDEEGTIAEDVGTGVKWTVPLTFMNLIPNSTSGSGTIYVDTYNGSTYVGTKYCGFTATVPASVKPSCSVAVTDATNITTTYGSPVKGLSKFSVTVTPTTAYGSPINSYSVTANDSDYSKASFTTDFLKSSGALTISATVTDKRGRSGSATKNVTVLDYTSPVISKLTVHRCNSDGVENDQGEYVKATFSATVTSLNSKNTAVYKIRYKKTSATSWTEATISALNKVYTATDQTYIFAADGNSSYNVELVVTDNHYPATVSTTVSTAFTLYNCHPSGTGWRFGGVAEDENTLQNDLSLKQCGNRYCASSPGTAGTAGYVLMAQITVTAANADTPITFVFSRRREQSTMTVHVQLRNASGTSATAHTVRYEGSNYDAYLAPTTGESSSSVWNLYVLKGSNYDTITLQDWWMSRSMESRVAVTFPGTLVSTVPTPYTKATPVMMESILDYIYPVDSVYISYSHKDPGTMFGGTWTRITNAFLWATDASGTIGQTGGSKTHTLTESELPQISNLLDTNFYSHQSYDIDSGALRYDYQGKSGSPNWSSNETSYGKIGIDIGGGQAHNNMPPYIQVSVWRRTA